MGFYHLAWGEFRTESQQCYVPTTLTAVAMIHKPPSDAVQVSTVIIGDQQRRLVSVKFIFLDKIPYLFHVTVSFLDAVQVALPLITVPLSVRSPKVDEAERRVVIPECRQGHPLGHTVRPILCIN